MTVFGNGDFRESQVVSPADEQAITEGNRYTFRHRFDGIAADATVHVLASIPSDARAVRVGTRRITSTASIRGEVYSNVTVDTQGTAQDERNDKIGAGEGQSDVDWYTGGAYSSLNNGTPILNPGGAGGTSTGGIGTGSTANVEPGTNLLWELTAQSSDTDILFETVYTQP